MGYCSAFKKKKTLSYAATQMNRKHIMPGEIGQSRNDKYDMIPLIRSIYGSQTRRENRVVVVRSWEWGERGAVAQQARSSSFAR